MPYTSPADVLRRMGRTAREASDTYTVREWASCLAAKAGPRDYRGQLKKIYDWICEHWRYVKEPDEWIHGSAKSLIEHVMGLKYKAPGRDPTRVNVLQLRSDKKGWGDCDDVATLVAAAVRAIGMHPFFRVTVAPDGSHVSTVAKTPTGEMVSIDPVGHPHRPFGWYYTEGQSYLFDLDGRQVDKQNIGVNDMPTDFAGIDGKPHHTTSQGHYCAVLSNDTAGPRCLSVPMRAARLLRSGIVLDGTPAIDERGRRYEYDSDRDLWVDHRLMLTPLCTTKEQFGGLRERGVRRARRRARRASRRKRRARSVRSLGRWARRSLSEGRVRNALGRFYKNPAVKEIVGTVGQGLGVPKAATSAVMDLYGRGLVGSSAYGRRQQQRFARRGGDPLERIAMRAVNMARQRGSGGGLSSYVNPESFQRLASMFSGVDSGGQCMCLRVGGYPVETGPLAELLYRDPHMGAQLLAARSKRYAMARRGMPGLEESGRYAMSQGGAQFPVAPVLSFSGVPGLYMGELDLTPRPTPGSWYRIQRGDTLFGIAGKAYKVGAGLKRLRRARWINSAKANRPVLDASSTDKFFPQGKISFYKKWSNDPGLAIQGIPGQSYAVIWIPEAAGDEPPPEVSVKKVQAIGKPILPPPEEVLTIRPSRPNVAAQTPVVAPETPETFTPQTAELFPELFPETKNMTLAPQEQIDEIQKVVDSNEVKELFPEFYPPENMTPADQPPLPPVTTTDVQDAQDEDPPPVVTIVKEGKTPIPGTDIVPEVIPPQDDVPPLDLDTLPGSNESLKPAAPMPNLPSLDDTEPPPAPAPAPASDGKGMAVLLAAGVGVAVLTLSKKKR